MPWAAGALLLTLALAACEKQPERIRVKLPKEAVQSVKMEPQLPVFEKKGDTIHLRASAFEKGDVYMGPAKVKWTVADPSVASVNYEGLVTARRRSPRPKDGSSGGRSTRSPINPRASRSRTSASS